MRGLFWILALFATAVGLSLAARYNDGYVLIFVNPKRIEFSLTLFVLLTVLAFFLFIGAWLYAHPLALIGAIAVMSAGAIAMGMRKKQVVQYAPVGPPPPFNSGPNFNSAPGPGSGAAPPPPPASRMGPPPPPM